MMENLTPEEEAAVSLVMQTPPTNPTATIDWTGDKWKAIKPRTWTAKNPENRLKLGKLDLITAGYPEDARLLTVSRLNGCFNSKLPKDERDRYNALKKTTTTPPTPAVPRRRNPKKGKERERQRFFSIMAKFL